MTSQGREERAGQGGTEVHFAKNGAAEEILRRGRKSVNSHTQQKKRNPCTNGKAAAPEGEKKLCTEKLCKKGTVRESDSGVKQKGWENSLRGIIAAPE